VNVDHTSIALGNGGCTVNLTGEGFNTVKTGSVISPSGTGNWVDAGAADTFNTIFGGAAYWAFNQLVSLTRPLDSPQRQQERPALALFVVNGQVAQGLSS
jgi:hypothetical protein